MNFKAYRVLFLTVFLSAQANAAVTSFFNDTQTATPVSSGTTSDTISSEGYLFTYTRDKLFTGGVGLTTPVGRYVRVPWPQGVEAQAITVGPVGNAQITISRVDGAVFDLPTFSAKLLANTAGAGASFEVMPLMNGEDMYNNPLFFNATGIAGNVFTYGPSSTDLLSGADAYKISLYVDFALTGITLVDASVAAVPVPPALWLFATGMMSLFGVARVARAA